METSENSPCDSYKYPNVTDTSTVTQSIISVSAVYRRGDEGASRGWEFEMGGLALTGVLG